MVVATVLVCWFVLIVEKVHDASPKTPQKVDAKASFSTVKTALSAVIGEPSSTIIHHSLAGRLLPEKVEVKRSEPESKKAIDNTTTNIPDKHPGATRIAILLALLSYPPCSSQWLSPNQPALICPHVSDSACLDSAYHGFQRHRDGSKRASARER
jgi:hypothetical protein